MSGHEMEMEKGKEKEKKKSKKKSNSKEDREIRKSSKKKKSKSSDKGEVEKRQSSSSKKKKKQDYPENEPTVSNGAQESHDAVRDELHRKRITEQEIYRSDSSTTLEEAGKGDIDHNLDLMESLSNMEIDEELKPESRPKHAEHETKMQQERARKKRQDAIERRERRLSAPHQSPGKLPGAVSMEGGNQVGKGGGGIVSSANARPGAVSMTGGHQAGKRRASAPSYAATTGTIHASRPGAVASIGGSPDGKHRQSALSYTESISSMPGAVPSMGGLQNGKHRTNTAKPGAVSMMGGRKNGKRGPEVTESSEAYDNMKTPGAVSMSSVAQKGKARLNAAPSVGQVGAVSVSRPASGDKENSSVVSDFFLRQAQKSLSQASYISSISHDTKSLSSNIGAMSVASSAPRGKGDGPSIVSSAESYDDASQLGAVSVAGLPRGKRTDESLASRGDSAQPRAHAAASVHTNRRRGRRRSARDGPGTHEEETSKLKGDDAQSVSVSTTSSKDRVSHFPASDLYASMSSLPDMSSTENKGRISEFPSEDFYEEDIDEQELASMKKAALQGPTYSTSGEDYESGNLLHDTRSQEGSLAHSRDRSTRSGISSGSQRSQVTEQQSNRRRSTGAFFINGEQVETRGRGSITAVLPNTGGSNLDLLVAEVVPSTEFYPANEYSVETNQIHTNMSESASSTLKSNSCHCSKTTFLCLAVAVAVAVVVIAVVVVVVVFKGDKGNGAESPAGSPTFDAERAAAIRLILLPITDEATLTDSSSPQFAAEQWIVEQDLFSTITAGANSTVEETIIITRYSLAVLFYSTGGASSWLSSIGWIEGSTDECKWEFLTCVVGQVSSINFGESGNNLIGSIPSEIKKLSALQELSFGRNSINQVHPDVGLLTNLLIFDFSTNMITGPFPDFILGLSTLQILRLERNELTGVIPSSLGSMTNLVYLILGQNKFTGTLTTELFGLQSLAGLDLSSNQQLEGNALDLINGLNQLAFLLLDGNSFTGHLDGQKLLGFPGLEILSMASNQLTGTIPSEIGSLASLGEVYLDGNRLNGTIPAEMANAPIKTITLDLNQLTGSVPAEFCASASLTSIVVDCSVACSCSTCAQNC